MTFEQERVLTELARNDSSYQEMLGKCGELEKEYLRICDTLSAGDRQLLDRYISFCEELEHQKVLLAFHIR